MRPEAATLRLAVFPRSGLLTDVVLVVAGAALVALAAQFEIKLWFTPVPITGQTFAVLLVGASLGCAARRREPPPLLPRRPRRRARLRGWGRRLGLGRGRDRRVPRRVHPRRRAGGLAGPAPLGPAVLLVGGGHADGERRHLRVRAPLARPRGEHGLEDTLEAGLYPFVVGDLLKLYLAGALLPGAWRLVERLRG